MVAFYLIFTTEHTIYYYTAKKNRKDINLKAKTNKT